MRKGGEERAVRDYCLTRMGRPGVEKKGCGGRSSRLQIWHSCRVQSSCGLFTLERLEALHPTEKIKQREC